MNELKEVLAGLDGNATMDALNASGEVTVTVGGVDEVLATEDLLVETAQIDGYVSEEGQNAVVDFSKRSGIITSDLSYEDTVDMSFVEKAIENGYAQAN